MSSALVLGYLDDLMLGGKVLASDLEVIMTEASSMGLAFNIAKCKVISQDPHLIFLKWFTITAFDDASLLGPLLSLGEALKSAPEARYSELAVGISRLASVSRQDELIPLHCSLSLPTLLHTLIRAPYMDHPA